jgi:heme/copper-type cytochrome/quinol oxidase subunit 1
MRVHDTYYVVAHFEWVLTLTAITLGLLTLVTLIRKRSENPRLQRLATQALRIWAIGLSVTLIATFATRFVPVETMVNSPWIIQSINATITAGTFLMVFALALIPAALIMSLWRMLRTTSG